MKKCPTCDKTFDDHLRFCQTDGTPLVEVAGGEPVDPYKTMVASKEDIAASLPVDPFKTIVGGMPLKEEEEVLELPDKPETPKTPVYSQENIQTQIKSSDSGAIKDEPISPFENPPPSYPPLSNKADEPVAEPPPPPKFNEPSLNPPSFGELSSTESDSKDKSPAIEKSSPIESEFKSPFDSPASPPIPSPFDMSMPPGYHPPTTPPFAEPEKPSSVGQDDFNQSPFGQQQNPFDQQVQQSNWTPPPAPDANWQNQQIGQNTPFQPPFAVQGQNNTLAIVSLITGILSILCLGFLAGIPAVILGFMARKNANENPAEYGGSGLALTGIILGAIGTLLSVVGTILYILLLASVN